MTTRARKRKIRTLIAGVREARTWQESRIALNKLIKETRREQPATDGTEEVAGDAEVPGSTGSVGDDSHPSAG